MKTFLPTIEQSLKAWPAGHAIFSFGVGKVETIDSTARITRQSFSDVSKVFANIYTRFTGKTLGKTKWQKFVRAVKNLAE